MVDEIKQAFAKFDKDKDGRVNALELGKIMREMGHNPTYGELETMIKENGGRLGPLFIFIFILFIYSYKTNVI
jgi:Ca2+-binding EF-hand superfamily protein